MGTLEGLEKFGWIGVLIIWTLDRLFPRLWSFMTDKFFPSRAQERAKKLQQEEDEARARREADASLLKAKIERELGEEQHRRRIEERMASAIEQMTQAMTLLNERVAHLITQNMAHDKFTTEAVGEMRETVIKLHKRDTQRKMRAVRKPAAK